MKTKILADFQISISHMKTKILADFQISISHMKTKILADFQISISVPLNQIELLLWFSCYVISSLI